MYELVSFLLAMYIWYMLCPAQFLYDGILSHEKETQHFQHPEHEPLQAAAWKSKYKPKPKGMKDETYSEG